MKRRLEPSAEAAPTPSPVPQFSIQHSSFSISYLAPLGASAPRYLRVTAAARSTSLTVGFDTAVFDVLPKIAEFTGLLDQATFVVPPLTQLSEDVSHVPLPSAPSGAVVPLASPLVRRLV